MAEESHGTGDGTPSRAVSEWLVANGWFPARDIGAEAEELVRIRAEDARRQGVTLSPLPSASRIVHVYGGLTLPWPGAGRAALIMEPTVGYDGDAAAITELAAALGTRLFPVGYEWPEYGIVLVDEHGRFFMLHHTGGYYMGKDEFDAFSRLLRSEAYPDAEDFFDETC